MAVHLDLIGNHRRSIETLSPDITLVDKVGEHLKGLSAQISKDITSKYGSHLDGVKRPTSRLRVELNTPDSLAALRSRDDTLDGRVVTVNEERSPTLREVLGKSKSVLMVLGLMGISAIIQRNRN